MEVIHTKLRFMSEKQITKEIAYWANAKFAGPKTKALAMERVERLKEALERSTQ